MFILFQSCFFLKRKVESLEFYLLSFLCTEYFKIISLSFHFSVFVSFLFSPSDTHTHSLHFVFHTPDESPEKLCVVARGPLNLSCSERKYVRKCFEFLYFLQRPVVHEGEDRDSTLKLGFSSTNFSI